MPSDVRRRAAPRYGTRCGAGEYLRRFLPLFILPRHCRPLAATPSICRLSAKLTQLLTPFVNYSLPLDVVTAVAALFCACVCLMLRKGRVPRPAAMASARCAGISGCSVCLERHPTVGSRFAIMLGLMLFAGFVPMDWPLGSAGSSPPRRYRCLLARMALLTTAWAQHRSDLADCDRRWRRCCPGRRSTWHHEPADRSGRLPGQCSVVAPPIQRSADRYRTSAPWC